MQAKIHKGEYYTGDENLAEIVQRFTVRKALIISNEPVFPKILEQYREEQIHTLNALKALREEIPLPSQEKDLQLAMRSLLAEYLSGELDLHYDRLSPELFHLPRRLGFPDGNAMVQVDIPLFARVNYTDREWHFAMELPDSYSGKYKMELKVTTPPIPREVKQKAPEAVAMYLSSCQQALKKEDIGELLLRDLEIENPPAMYSLQISWIPTPEEMNLKIEHVRPVVRDPLLVLSFYDRHYLIAKWDVQGEEPYEHYVKEFTDKKRRGN